MFQGADVGSSSLGKNQHKCIQPKPKEKMQGIDLASDDQEKFSKEKEMLTFPLRD